MVRNKRRYPLKLTLNFVGRGTGGQSRPGIAAGDEVPLEEIDL